MLEAVLILASFGATFVAGYVSGAADANEKRRAPNEDLNDLPRIAERIRRDMARHEMDNDRHAVVDALTRQHHPAQCPCFLCKQHRVTQP